MTDINSDNALSTCKINRKNPLVILQLLTNNSTELKMAGD